MSRPQQLQPATSQLTGKWARAFIWAYFLTTAVLALWTISDVSAPVFTVVGLVLFAGVCLSLSLETGARLSLAGTLFICGVGVANALMISWNLHAGGFSQWYFGAGTVALFLVSLRGRIGLAWLGFGAMAAVIAIWGATTGVPTLECALIIGRQAPILLVGTMFATGLRRTGDTIERVTSAASGTVITEAAAEATAHERATRLAALDAAATPLLRRLVARAVVTESERMEFVVAEAALRDGLRARSLSVPIVAEAARDARMRGVDVILLDDSTPGGLTDSDLRRAANLTASVLRRAGGGTVTARLLPAGRANIATVVADGPSHESHELRRSDGPPRSA